MDFAGLIAPISTDVFFADYWEKSYLYSPGDGGRDFSSLLSLRDLDSVLHYLRNGAPNTILIGSALGESPAASFKQIGGADWSSTYEQFHQGSTIVVNSLHLTWAPVSRLCAALFSEIGAKMQANLYVTPARGKGFGCHWDGHDVLVLQLDGTKTWTLYNQIDELPRPTSSGAKYDAPANPIREVTLMPGDVLYVPRGMPHEARAEQETSAHLTLGIEPATWEDLLHACVHDLCTRHPTMRRSLPFGWSANGEVVAARADGCRPVVDALLDPETVQDALDLLAIQMLENAPCLPDGHFTQRDLVDRIGLDTIVARRSGNRLRIIRNGRGVVLHHPCGSLAGPPKLLWALKFMAGTERFRVGDIPGWYSDAERLLLTKRLVRNGFLRVMALSPDAECQLRSR